MGIAGLCLLVARLSDAPLSLRTSGSGMHGTRPGQGSRIVGREDVDSAPALLLRFGGDAGVGSGLGPGLTSESADAARVVLLTICRPGPNLRHPPALPV